MNKVETQNKIMKKNKIHIIWLAIVIVAFVGGSFYGKSMAPSAGSTTRAGFRGPQGGPPAGNIVAGQVTAIDADSITVQLPNGSSENVFYSNSTQVIVPTPSSITSVKSGTTVIVNGTQNADGSMTASTIQVRIPEKSF